MRRFAYIGIFILALLPIAAGFIGNALGPGILHPANLNRPRCTQADAMLARTGARKADFTVHADDGIELRGWKIVPSSPNGDWVLLFHGVSDNRTGDLGHAEFLLRHGYSVVMMDSRAHGESGGQMATDGWKERYDAVAISNALYASENVRHLYALGVSSRATPIPRAADLRNRGPQNSLPPRTSNLPSPDRTQRIVDRARSRPRLSPGAGPGGIRKSRNQFLQKISSKLTRRWWFAICHASA
jgi:fermentation-respiration switch protein FrsA (DUF1100 family)